MVQNLNLINMNSIDKLYQDVHRFLPHLTDIYTKDGQMLCDLFISRSNELEECYKQIFEFKIKKIQEDLNCDEYDGISQYYIYLSDEMPSILSSLKHVIEISFNFNFIKYQTKEYLIDKINKISW